MQEFLKDKQLSPFIDDKNLNSNIVQICPVIQNGFIKISGEDAKTFLQGQLTCNMDKLSANQYSFGAHCDTNGRVVANFRIFADWQQPNCYLICLPEQNCEPLLKSLKKYSIFSKVNLDIVTPEISQLCFAGKGILDPFTNLIKQEINVALKSGQLIKINNKDVYVHYDSEHNLSLFLNTNDLNTLWENLNNNDELSPQLIITDIWSQLQIEQKIPQILPETAGLFLPHHINLVELGAVSFDKGCYLGQEIIARMHYKGKIKKHLYHAKLDEKIIDLLVGDKIYNESKTVGHIINFQHLENQQTLLLVVLEDEYHNLKDLFIEKPANKSKYYLTPTAHKFIGT